jgi:hypothetical protein
MQFLTFSGKDLLQIAKWVDSEGNSLKPLSTYDVKVNGNWEVIKITESVGKKSAAVVLGREGGKKGGKRRAEILSPERRKEIARKAARARWISKK